MDNECILPPQVCGHPSGELTVKVDEIFWASKSPGDVYVHLQWWGEKNYNIIWPLDLKKDRKPARPNSVRYIIRTSPSLFETYLKNCRDLTFYVVKETDRTIIGTCTLKNLNDILTVKTYSASSCYYPLYNFQRTRIGDLRICFSLELKNRSDNEVLSKLPKKCPVALSAVLSTPGPYNLPHKKKIVEAVTKGQELRKAMALSVIKDCPNDKVDSIINGMNTIEENTPVASPTKELPQIIDYIIGKKMSEAVGEHITKTPPLESPHETVTTNKKKAKKLGEAASLVTTTTKSRTTSPISIDNATAPPRRSSNTIVKKPQSPAAKFHVSEIFYKEDIKKISNDLFNITKYEQQSKEDHNLQQEQQQKPKQQQQQQRNVQKKIKINKRAKTSATENNMVGELISTIDAYRTVDCFKFTIRDLYLEAVGVRKISISPSIKPTDKQIRMANAPGTLFSVEFRIPSRQGLKAYHKPTVFLSKRCHGNEVLFRNSIVHKLPCGEDFPWLKVSRLCYGSEIKVYWRHLNQRLPSLLGSATIPEIKPTFSNQVEPSLSINVPVPVLSNHKQLVGKLIISVELGRNNKVFGEQLFNALFQICGYKGKKDLHTLNTDLNPVTF